MSSLIADSITVTTITGCISRYEESDGPWMLMGKDNDLFSILKAGDSNQFDAFYTRNVVKVSIKGVHGEED